ncbi:MAG: hypothetical protein QHH18_07805 [Candidatus Bathyarchaeota archaeon]|jgi:hypothetical protein|nr:hypothetical protein [Candidatus Bathyarchaeota archaeon A05DMB-5]MDH7558484.1 hypothetical protein [Candidatus Bathyarchaeota archaeon]
MQIPIRIIGVATTIFWIFLIIFAITAVYSVKDVSFEFGEPQMNLTEDGEMVFSLPVTITNKGFYNIGFFNVTTKVSDENGHVIAEGSSSTPLIKSGEKVTAIHNMTVNFSDLMQNNQNYLFNDTELKIFTALGMGIAQAIPVQASTNMSIPWGAPLYNFMLGTPEHVAFNSTHARVTVPVSFENHAFFDVTGTMQVKMYNNADLLVSESQTAVDALQHSFYEGYVEFYVPTTRLTHTGYFEVYFLTPVFNYGPLVIPYG